MMSMTMFRGADAPADTSEYSDLTDAACSLIPLCAAARGLSQTGTDAAGGVVDESLKKAQEAATQVSAPILAQLARLESTITWAAVGTIVALALATGSVIYFSARRK